MELSRFVKVILVLFQCCIYGFVCTIGRNDLFYKSVGIHKNNGMVVIIRDSQNRVLLTKRAFDPGKGTFDLPGGFVDPLEQSETAVDREIREELNLKIAIRRKYYIGDGLEYLFKFTS